MICVDFDDKVFQYIAGIAKVTNCAAFIHLFVYTYGHAAVLTTLSCKICRVRIECGRYCFRSSVLRIYAGAYIMCQQVATCLSVVFVSVSEHLYLSSTNRTDHHDITAILLKMALSTILVYTLTL